MRVKEDIQLCLVQVLLVANTCRCQDPIGVVEQDAEVADTADTGFRADGRITRFDTRVAEGALLGLARLPVEVDFLVRTTADTHTPATALVLVDQDDAILLAFVDRPAGAGRDTGGVEAVLAQTRQVHHEGIFELAVNLLLDVLKIGILAALAEFTAEYLFPVRAPHGFFHALAGDDGLHARGRRGP